MKTAIVAVLVVVLLVVVGVGAFYAGSNYGLTQAQNIRNEFFASRQGGQGGQGQFGQGGQGGQGAQGAQGQFGRPVANGTVKSVQGNTFVVSQRDGTTVTVTMNAQTQIQKTVTGTASDIQPGELVTIMSDQTGSSVTARQIQLRPAAAQTQ